MIKKRNFKGFLSVVLTAVIILISVMPCFAAVNYPADVTKEQALVTIDKADTAIGNIMKTMDTSLEEIVLREVYSDEVLSMLLLELYKMIEANAGNDLAAVGINTSVSSLAKELTDYPQIAEKLSAYSLWSEVNLSGASWNVKNKSDFAVAVASMFAPFYDVLYALLCNGSYSLNLLVGIKGSNGYETAIIPTLRALGCEDITDAETYYKQAEDDKGTMIYNIVYDLLTFAEDALETPCNTLSENLPSIANYLVNGGFDNAVSTLVAPLRLEVLNISTMVPIESLTAFISDSESFTQNFTLNFNDMLATTGIPMAPVDLQLIASLGSLNEDGTVTADKADTFVVLLRWIVDTLKLNQASIGEFLPEADESMLQMISTVLSKETDSLISLVFSLFNQTGAFINENDWTYKTFTAGTVTYTPNLPAEKYQRVADNIDELLDQLIAETGEAKSVGQIIKRELYSSKTLSLIAGIAYGALEGEEVEMITSLLGMNLSPKSVAEIISAKGFRTAGANLAVYSKWSDIGENGFDWGIKTGNKREFVSALASLFSPFEELLGMLLAEDKVVLFDSIEFYGSNGYNTAVIPVYEALGCKEDTIKTQEEFKKLYHRGKGIEALLDPIVSLFDRIVEKPVYTVLEILPNLLYFLDGGIETCIKNLLYPFEDILSQLGIENVIDLSMIANLDINQLLTEVAGSLDLGITLPAIDIKFLGSLGTPVQMTSKRTVNGQPATITYIQSDMPALSVSMLRILAETIKAPENSGLFDTLLDTGMGGSFELPEGTDGIVTSFAESILADINAMSVDETTEWLYKLFFRERATVQTPDPEENYMPTIIYKPKRDYTPVLLIFAVLIIIPLGVIVRNKIRMKKLEDNSQDNIQEV